MIVFIQKSYNKNFRIFNFSNLREINPSIIACVLMLSVISFTLLYSAAGGSLNPWAIRQFFYLLISIPISIAIISIHPKILSSSAILIYLLSILMLIIVKFAGHNAMGAQRWIDLKIIHIQPSEIAKIAMILILAKYFDRIPFSINSSWYGIFPPIAIFIVPATLVVTQPDLATAITISGITIMMIFASGAAIKNFVIGFGLFLLSTPVIWNKMHEYQKNRIVNFLFPANDPLGSGYNVIQSKIAIGSGGIAGKGFLKGCQSQLNFIPESQTDFIFTILGEEFGLIGSIILIGMYFVLIMYGFYVSINVKSIFLKMTSLGGACFFFVHVAINLGMTMGIMPAAGIPMPLVSYGGTSFVSSIICASLIFNAAVHGLSSN